MSWEATLSYSTTDPSDPVGNITNTILLHNYSGEDLLIRSGFEKSEGLYNNKINPIIDQLTFKAKLRTSLANALLNLDASTIILVNVDLDAADYFTGYLRPSIDLDVNNKSNTITFQALDNSYRLDRNISETVRYNDKKICDPGDTGNSLVHLILNAAAGGTWPAGEISGSLLTDTTVVEWVKLTKDSKTYKNYLTNILASYQLMYAFDEAGDFYLIDIEAASVSTTTTFSDSNIISKLKTKRTLPDSDGVEVAYRQAMSTSGNICSQQYNDDSGHQYIQIDSGETLPAVDERLIKFQPEGVEFLGLAQGDSVYGDYMGWYTPLIGVYDYTDFSGWTVINITNAKLDVRIDYTPSGSFPQTRTITGITFPGSGSRDIYFYDGGYGAFFGTLHYSADEDGLKVWFASSIDNIRLKSASLTGDFEAVTQNGPAKTNISALKQLKVNSDYVFTDTEADTLATWHQTRINNSAYTYSFTSQVAADIGEYVRITNTTLNIDAKTRVLKKKTTIKSNQFFYSYECEGVDDLESLYGLITKAQPAFIPSTGSMEGVSAAVANGLYLSGQITKAVEGPLIESLTPNETGLYLTSELMGYYDATSLGWHAYIKNDGDFYFGGNGDNYIGWDGSKLEIAGEVAVGKSLTVAGSIDIDGSATVDGSITVGGSADITGTLGVGTAIDMDGSGVGVITFGTGGSISGASAGAIDIGTAITLDGTGAGEINVNDDLIINGTDKRYEVYDSTPTLKMAFGYLNGIESYTTEYGLYIAAGNECRIESGGEFVDNDYLIQDDGAFVVNTLDNTEVVRLGSLGSGDIGLDIGGVKFGAVLGGGSSSGTFGDLLGGGGSSGTFGSVLGGGTSIVGRNGLLYSLDDDRMYLYGDAIVDGTVRAAAIDVDDLFAQEITLKDSGFIQSEGYVAGSTGLKITATGEIDLNIGADDSDRSISIGKNGILAKDSEGEIIHDICPDVISTEFRYAGHYYPLSYSASIGQIAFGDSTGNKNIDISAITTVDDLLDYSFVELAINCTALIDAGATGTSWRASGEVRDLDTYNDNSGPQRYIGGSALITKSASTYTLQGSWISGAAKIHNNGGTPYISLYIVKTQSATSGTASWTAPIQVVGLYR